MMQSPPPDTDQFAILLNGLVLPSERLRQMLAGRRVIAADGGMRHADALGVKPELWIGDFDSASPALLEQHWQIEQMRFSAAKACSDGDLAVQQALLRGATNILLCGAAGGPRSDHMLFNLAQMSLWAAQEHATVFAANGHEDHHVMTGPQSAAFDYKDGTVFSVFPIGEVSGLTISGAQWPLNDVELEFGSTLTLSNVVQGPLSIKLDNGRVIVIVQTEMQPE